MTPKFIAYAALYGMALYLSADGATAQVVIDRVALYNHLRQHLGLGRTTAYSALDEVVHVASELSPPPFASTRYRSDGRNYRHAYVLDPSASWSGLWSHLARKATPDDAAMVGAIVKGVRDTTTAPPTVALYRGAPRVDHDAPACCARCGETKDADEFPAGRRSWCVECHRVYAATRRGVEAGARTKRRHATQVREDARAVEAVALAASRTEPTLPYIMTHLPQHMTSNRILRILERLVARGALTVEQPDEGLARFHLTTTAPQEPTP